MAEAERLVIIKRDETPLDGAAQLRFEASIDEAFPAALRELQQRIGNRAR